MNVIMIYDLGYWRVPISNRDKHREVMQTIYSNLKINRKNFPVTSSRLFIMKADSDIFETWLYINAFADETAHAQNSMALENDPKIATLRKEWKSLILPDSFKAEMWTEFAPDLWI